MHSQIDAGGGQQAGTDVLFVRFDAASLYTLLPVIRFFVRRPATWKRLTEYQGVTGTDCCTSSHITAQRRYNGQHSNTLITTTTKNKPCMVVAEVASTSFKNAMHAP